MGLRVISKAMRLLKMEQIFENLVDFSIGSFMIIEIIAIIKDCFFFSFF
mgnify:CR=1 FL=1|jgi:hypothetical protein